MYILFLIAVKFPPRKAQLELSSTECKCIFLFASPPPWSIYCLRIPLTIIDTFNRVILQVKCDLQIAVLFVCLFCFVFQFASHLTSLRMFSYSGKLQPGI